MRMLSTALFHILEMLEETEYRMNGPTRVAVSPPGICDGELSGITRGNSETSGT
jgi:hypothetical protein